LAGLYVLYVMIVAKLRPDMAPPLTPEERRIALPADAQALAGQGYTHAMTGMLAAMFKGRRNSAVSMGFLSRNMALALAPLMAFVLLTGSVYYLVTEPPVVYEIPDELRLGGGGDYDSGLAEPPAEDGLAEPPADGGLAEPPGAAPAAPGPAAEAAPDAGPARPAAPAGYWIFFGVCVLLLAIFYALLTWARLEIFKMLMGSFFPLALMIAAVLGSITFGLATPSEAAAMGAMGGALLALAYRRLNMPILKESVFLTAKTSAMVCWLFVGSSIFSAAFALLGGQRIIEEW